MADSETNGPCPDPVKNAAVMEETSTASEAIPIPPDSAAQMTNGNGKYAAIESPDELLPLAEKTAQVDTNTMAN
jgi:hypothetical protein